MRVVRTVAAWVTLALLFFCPVIVGVLFPRAPLAVGLACALWFGVFIVVPSIRDARSGRVSSGRSLDPSDRPYWGGDGGDGGDGG